MLRTQHSGHAARGALEGASGQDAGRGSGPVTPPGAPTDVHSPPPQGQGLLWFPVSGSQRGHKRQGPGEQHHDGGNQQPDGEERQRHDGDLGGQGTVTRGTVLWAPRAGPALPQAPASRGRCSPVPSQSLPQPPGGRLGVGVIWPAALRPLPAPPAGSPAPEPPSSAPPAAPAHKDAFTGPRAQS